MPKRKNKRIMIGGAWYNDIWDGIKSVGSAVLPILKSTGAASTLAGVAGQPGLAAGLKLAGLGHKRKQRGRGKTRSVINA